MRKCVCRKLNPLPVCFPGNQCHLENPRSEPPLPRVSVSLCTPVPAVPLPPRGRVPFPSAVGIYTKDAVSYVSKSLFPCTLGSRALGGTEAGGHRKGRHCTSQDHRGPGPFIDPPAPAGGNVPVLNLRDLRDGNCWKIWAWDGSTSRPMKGLVSVLRCTTAAYNFCF